MDYKHAAQQVLDCIGGKDNIVSAAHCATRLRLVIADNAKVNKQELENAEGAKGVFEAQGQLQIIFGTGTVNKVYDEFIQLAGIEGGSKEDVKQAAAAKAPWYQRAIKTLGDIFVPIIPAIVASGFLMGIMEALNFMVNNGFLNIDTTGSVYVFAKLFSNTAYTFLPILIATPRQGIRRQPLSGCSHRHDHDPPRPAERLDRFQRHQRDAAGVRRPVLGAAGGLSGPRHPGHHRRVAHVPDRKAAAQGGARHV